jgi:hypothetical protein
MLNQALAFSPIAVRAVSKGSVPYRIARHQRRSKRIHRCETSATASTAAKLVVQMPTSFHSRIQKARPRSLLRRVSEESARMLAEYTERLKNSPFERTYTIWACCQGHGQGKKTDPGLNLALKFNPHS